MSKDRFNPDYSENERRNAPYDNSLGYRDTNSTHSTKGWPSDDQMQDDAEARNTMDQMNSRIDQATPCGCGSDQTDPFTSDLYSDDDDIIAFGEVEVDFIPDDQFNQDVNQNFSGKYEDQVSDNYDNNIRNTGSSENPPIDVETGRDMDERSMSSSDNITSTGGHYSDPYTGGKTRCSSGKTPSSSVSEKFNEHSNYSPDDYSQNSDLTSSATGKTQNDSSSTTGGAPRCGSKKY